MTERLSPQDQHLKAATRELYRAVGGQEEAAAIADRPQSQMSDYVNLSNPEKWQRFIPINLLRKVEGCAHGTPGFPQVTRALAHELGFGLVPLPRPKPDDKSWAQHSADLMQQLTDVPAKLQKALATNNDLTPEEARELDILGEVREAMQVLVDFENAVQRMMAGDTS